MRYIAIATALLLSGCEPNVKAYDDDGRLVSMYVIPSNFKYVSDDISITNGTAIVTVRFKRKMEHD